VYGSNLLNQLYKIQKVKELNYVVDNNSNSINTVAAWSFYFIHSRRIHTYPVGHCTNSSDYQAGAGQKSIIAIFLK